VLLLGQDVGRLGGVFRITTGLLERFGEDRVTDTPLSESAIVGAGIGLALGGKRPICEVQFAGFLLAAYDQVRSHAARFRSRTRSQHTVPLLIRAPFGAAVGAPECHSDSVEMLFVSTPGIKVVVPSSPRRARALLKAALRDPDPVLFLEPIPLYRTMREAVPNEDETLPLGRSLLLRRGRDITVATYGAMVQRVLQAADLADGAGVEVEVIDLMTLSPLDTATLAHSAHKTGHLLVVHEGCRTGDIAAEILARLHRHMGPGFRFDRVCGWDTGLPHHGREHDFVPSVERIRDAILDLLLRG
jgi:pyruvate dehydrogenase E1 component beta subunit